jgi:hypothetical protein
LIATSKVGSTDFSFFPNWLFFFLTELRHLFLFFMFLGLMIRSKPCKQSQQKSTRVDWAERFFSVLLVRCNPGVVALHGWLNHQA